MFKDVISAIKFAIKNRKILLKLRKEIWEVKDKVQTATADKKVTKAELKGILMEVDDCLDLVINKLLEE